MAGQANHGCAATARRAPDVVEVLAQRHDHRFCAGFGEVGGDLALGTPRVHRHHGTTHADCQQADRKFRAIRYRKRAAVARSQVHAAERCAFAEELMEPVVRQWTEATPGGARDRALVPAAGQDIQKRGERQVTFDPLAQRLAVLPGRSPFPEAFGQRRFGPGRVRDYGLMHHLYPRLR